MNNPTDTNQASEVGKALITATLSLRHAEIATRPGSVEDAERSFESAVRYISDFIRTEKLKLLAEIGEPKLNDAINMKPEQYEGGAIINDWYKNRTSKLEAELCLTNTDS